MEVVVATMAPGGHYPCAITVAMPTRWGSSGDNNNSNNSNNGGGRSKSGSDGRGGQGTRLLVKNLTVDVRPGETLVVVGPSGIGKTSFARPRGPRRRHPSERRDRRRQRKRCARADRGWRRVGAAPRS